MRKFVLVLLGLFLCCAGSHAVTFDFNAEGNNSSNEILKNVIKENFDDIDCNVISYYYDIDNDGIQEIIGIAKSSLFYSPEGYKLIALKNKDDNWVFLHNNIYFDLTKTVNIENHKVEYYKTSLYKNRKHTSKISNKVANCFKESTIKQSMKNSNKVLKVNEGTSGEEIDLSAIEVPVQRAVKIQYKNLSDRTKHYLEMK